MTIPSTPVAGMIMLHIALQEGFENDAVIVKLNQQVVYQKSDVKTRLQIGLAAAFDVPVNVSAAGNEITVEVVLPEKNRSLKIPIALSSPQYLGISVTEQGDLVYQVSREPFGYL